MTLRQQVFNSPGTWTWPGNISYVDVFVVGGGGGAANRIEPFPAPLGGPVTSIYGGGGGGVRYEVGVPVSAPVPVTIGSGGAAQPLAPAPNVANPGGDSSFGPITVGGGGGANLDAPPNGGGGGGENTRNNLGGTGGLYGGSVVSPATRNGGLGGRQAQQITGNAYRLSVATALEAVFDVGTHFEGYGCGGVVGGNEAYFYGNHAANMGGGGGTANSPVLYPGTSGVVIVRWFE